MAQDLEKTKKIAGKVMKNGGSTSLAHLEATVDISDKMDEAIQAIKDIPKTEFPEPQKSIEVDLKGVDVVTLQGKPGVAGKDGKNGRDGTNGRDGKDGAAGPKGEKGDQGLAGKDGLDGYDGKDGRNGKDMIGLAGPDIVAMLEAQPEEYKLSPYAIKGIYGFIRSIAAETTDRGGLSHAGGMETPIKDSTGKMIAKDASGAWILPASSSGSGTVTSIASADASITVTNGTTTADLSVASAPKLTTGRTISISGDLVYASPAFDGTGNVTAAGTLATVNGNVGSFGSATQVGTFTVNAKGLITAAGNATVTPAVGSITGLGTGVATMLAAFSSANIASACTDETGTGALMFGTDPALTVSSPTATSVGYLGMPQNSKSAAYTTVMADSGKHILHPTADNNARTFTIDSNANVAYPIGTVLTFINQINTVTIAITTDTMTLAGSASTGSRTLAAGGIATAVKIASTAWIINGTGLT